MNNEDILEVMREWDEVLFQHEKEFLHVFCHDAWMLAEVSWSSENMRFVYIVESGQHICDSVKIEKWFEFMDSNKGETE